MILCNMSETSHERKYLKKSNWLRPNSTLWLWSLSKLKNPAQNNKIKDTKRNQFIWAEPKYNWTWIVTFQVTIYLG